ncbi:MAG: cysteine--tRNA ligase [Candidatus Sungbacteria bacterium]|uniref:Cysteine--tRNA ligase n=1 Tax=Candidatus Sungiibacteriota bacterium TaxID=2750080 RepID=A0A9D6QRT1_9BACT|nr:cysteine--tRNA ligase [Candidatus Sungbacteria bacterium]
MPLQLYNTLTKKKEIFRSIKPRRVGLYTCGPTVYHYAHIGNMRTYIFEDILRRTLEYLGYRVKQVMNITDVGHLTDDNDSGEDKLERGARREAKSVFSVAKFYTKAFVRDLEALNIKKPSVLSPATKHIKGQIKMIERLVKKGYAYDTAGAVYFAVLKFKDYTKLSGKKLEDQQTGAREGVAVDSSKRNPEDFALWFKIVGRFKNHILHWPSPWGDGFPGWHIECSAISTHYLGQPFDIHTGGVDHIGTHHTNEIAQSEAAFDRPLARYWLHGEFLNLSNQKMAKSAGDMVTIETLRNRGFDPLAYRYFVSLAHYRSILDFSWEGLKSAQNAYRKLLSHTARLKAQSKNKKLNTLRDASIARELKNKFIAALENDLNTPIAISIIWFVISSQRLNPKSKYRLLIDFDRVLGLQLKSAKIPNPPHMVRLLSNKREKARQIKNWKQADALRRQMSGLNWEVDDTPDGPVLIPKRQEMSQ